MADLHGTVHEAVFETWHRGWAPRNLPSTYLFPRELLEGQVIDARGVRFSNAGVMRWERNQFSIDGPTGANVGAVKSLVEFRTADYNQILSVNKFGAGAPYTAQLAYQDVTWVGATPTQTTYGYELFNGGTWNVVSNYATGLERIDSNGIADAAQLRDLLLLCNIGDYPCFWDGTQCYPGFYEPPGAAVTGVDTGAGVLSLGTYSYYYTYYRPGPDLESMPSPIEDVHLTVNDRKVKLTGVTDYGEAYYKRIYRAYTSDSGNDARGDVFYLLTELGPGTTTGSTEDLTSGWVPKDTEGRQTVGANSAAYVALEEDDEVYLTKDIGVGLIGDFDYRFTLDVTSADTGGIAIIFGAGAALGAFSTSTNSLAVTLEDTGSTQLYIRYVFGGVEGQSPLSVGVADGDTRYLRLVRADRTTTLYVHTASDYSDEPEAISLTVTLGDTTMRYIYAGNTYGGAGTYAATFELSDVVLDATTEFYDNIPNYALADPDTEERARPPAGTILAAHKNRLWMAGSTEGSRSYSGYGKGYWGNVLFFSQLDEPYYWPGVNTITIGDDTEITGLASWGDFLVVFKENSVWTVTGYAESDFVVTLLTDAVGGVDERAYCAAPPGVLWLGPDAFYFWAGSEVRKLMDTRDANWGTFAARATIPTMTFHAGRYYIMQDGYLLEWEPSMDVWNYTATEWDDADSDEVGLRTFSFGEDQTHVLTRMSWQSSGVQYITVLDPAGKIANRAAAGTSYSNEYAPVQVTLPPLPAPPGYVIVPMEVWVDGSWDKHATSTLRPYIYLNDDADYSATAGQNAWATTPECPQANAVIGVPPSYTYSGTSYRTNAYNRWYIQIKGEYAKNFVLRSVGVRYALRRASGA